MPAVPLSIPLIFLVRPAFPLDGPLLKQLTPTIVRRGFMRTKGTPAQAPVPSPEANEPPVESLSTPPAPNVTGVPNHVTPLEKAEIVGTLPADPRLTGQVKPGANMNRVETPATHVERVVSVEVQVAIRSRLRNKGVWLQEIDDIAQTVTAELLAMADPPDDMDGCLAAARRAANDESIDTFRKSARRGAHNAGPTPYADRVTAEDPTEAATWHPIDRARQIALLREKLDDGSLSARDAQLLALDADGADAIEIGQELNLAPQTVRNALSRAKGVVRAAWNSRLKGPLALLAVLLLSWWAKREHDRRAQRDRNDIHQDAPFAPPLPPMERADRLRHDARDACADRDWMKCIEELDDAKKLDPAGEERPEVQEMRQRIENETRLSGPKPGERPVNP